MVYRPLPMNFKENYDSFDIKQFAGIDYSGDSTQIAFNRSPHMVNCVLDSKNSLDKRPGYKRAFATEVSASPIRGLFYYKKTDKLIFATDGKLYQFTPGSEPTLLYTGVNDSRIIAFEMNDKIYFLDGVNYLQYDGTDIVTVESVAYVPTVGYSRPPAGDESILEYPNLLQPYMIDSFSGDGTSKDYYIYFDNIDALQVYVSTDGGLNYVTTGFTVDTTLGKVTFSVAPALGVNNVKIKYAKTVTGNADKIKKCTIFAQYGGDNDTRVFLAGNPDLPNYDFRSGLYDPTYFPDNGYSKIGTETRRIMGYSLQYDTLIIHLDKGKWNRKYEYNNGNPLFPARPINDDVGVVAIDTIQLIDNSPTALHKKGVYRLTGGSVRDERNVEHLSSRVEPNLLQEANLDTAISFDFEKKHGICLNNKIYIWDYAQDEWLLWDNIPASCFLEYGKYLYFGSNTKGLVYRFKKSNESRPYNDDETVIAAEWRSKIISMNADNLEKFIEAVFYTLKPNTRASVDFYYITNKKASELVKTSRVDLFNWDDIDFDHWSFLISEFPQSEKTRVKANNIVYIQIILKNDRIDETMGVTNVSIKFDITGEVK